MPRVSVLMPVHDAAAYLEEALMSLARQSYTDFELVVVNDGSRDESGAILDAFSESDPRVRVIHGEHQGLVAALSLGLKECRGELIARMDADDVAHSSRLEMQVALLDAQPEIGVASCLVHAFGAPLGAGMARYVAWVNSVNEPEDIARARFIESPVVHPSVVIRRELLDGGYRSGVPEDYDLWLRLLGRGIRFAKVPKILLDWRDHPARATRSDLRYASERMRAIKLEHLLDGPLASAPPLLLLGAGREGKPFLRLLQERNRPVPFVIDRDPRKIGNVVYGARVVHEDRLPGLLTPGTVVLAAIGVPSARAEIRATLEGLSLREGESFWFLC